MIKHSLSLLVAMALISGCATLSEAPDPFVGQWEIEYSRSPGGNPNATMKINKEDGVYTGSLTNPTGEYELNDLTIDSNGELNAGLNYQGYSVKVSATIEGTTITGQNNVLDRTFDFAGEKVE